MVQEGEKELNGPAIGPQGIGPAVAAVQVQQKGLGLFLAGKPDSLQLLHHLGQQPALAEKLPVSSRGQVRREIGATTRWG
jgi:hypothetical protein